MNGMQRGTMVELLDEGLETARERLADVEGNEEETAQVIGYIEELEDAKRALIGDAMGFMICRCEGECALDMLMTYDLIFPMRVTDTLDEGETEFERELQNMEEAIEWADRTHWEWEVWGCEHEEYKNIRGGQKYAGEDGVVER